MGAVITVVIGWSAFGLITWVVPQLEGQLQSWDLLPSSLSYWLAILFWIASFVAISFVIGVICALFWHPIASEDHYRFWGLWVLLAIFFPSMIFSGFSALIFPFCLPVFGRGTDYGAQWWPNRRWRHLFGLANDWEREKDEP